MAGGDAADAELSAPGLAMRDAITADLLRLEDYDVSVASGSVAEAVLRPAVSPQPRAGEAPCDFVARHADASHLVWVVAPETAGLLAGFQRRVDPARWLGCDHAAIALASSKRRTSALLGAAGVTTPLAFEHARGIARWVVKPDDGAGAVATRVHADRRAAVADASERACAGSPGVIEPWVDGEALSLSLMCRSGRCELLSVNRQRLSIDAAGWLAYRGVELNVLAPGEPRTALLAALATQVGLAIPGLRGFVGIDLVWHPQRGPVVIEVNPRVTCAYVGLSQALGRNLAAEVIDAHGLEAARARS